MWQSRDAIHDVVATNVQFATALCLLARTDLSNSPLQSRCYTLRAFLLASSSGSPARSRFHIITSPPP
jgi:hypothetical protein